MEKVHIQLAFDLCDESELSQTDANLLQAAKESMANAYAPYSNFLVGAAVLLDNGIVFRGNNQENAAYPSGLCAERVALFAANAQYPTAKPVAMAITAQASGHILEHPIPPCGACRQVIAESEFRYGQAIRLILQGQTALVMISDSIAQFLPLAFDAKSLLGKK